MDKQLDAFLHPYLFVLKEGKGFKENMLDYSLLMLHVRCHEIIKTPKQLSTTIQTNSKNSNPIKEITPKLPQKLTPPLPPKTDP